MCSRAMCTEVVYSWIVPGESSWLSTAGIIWFAKLGDSSTWPQFITCVISFFNFEGFVRTVPEMTDYTGQNLVFIVGCPRSGTTWLQRLLASHPQIRSGEESHFFDMYVGPQLRTWKGQFKNLSASGVGHLVGPPAYFREAEFISIVRNYLLELLTPMVKSLQPGELFVEKTPSHALF